MSISVLVADDSKLSRRSVIRALKNLPDGIHRVCTVVKYVQD